MVAMQCSSSTIGLGLDVSKLTIDVCMLFADGKKLTIKIENSQAGFLELARFLHGLELSQIHACLEPTGRYSRPVTKFLESLGIKVSLVNSFTVQNHGRSKNFRNKTDKIDSFLLADYCLKHNPRATVSPSETQEELKDIQLRLKNIDDQIRQEENRLEAGPVAKVVREDIEDSLGRLYVRRKKLEAAAKELMRENPVLHKNYKILNSIIGIGESSAIRLLALITFENFADGRKIGEFSGLAPTVSQSGTSVKSKAQISKIGNPEIRRGLYFPAMVAMQHNPQLRAFAERLKAKNKPGKVIICAVMRKLLVLASALIRKNEFYDPHYSR